MQKPMQVHFALIAIIDIYNLAILVCFGSLFGNHEFMLHDE